MKRKDHAPRELRIQRRSVKSVLNEWSSSHGDEFVVVEENQHEQFGVVTQRGSGDGFADGGGSEPL